MLKLFTPKTTATLVSWGSEMKSWAQTRDHLLDSIFVVKRDTRHWFLVCLATALFGVLAVSLYWGLQHWYDI